MSDCVSELELVSTKASLANSPTDALINYYFLVRDGIHKATRDLKAPKIYDDSKS